MRLWLWEQPVVFKLQESWNWYLPLPSQIKRLKSSRQDATWQLNTSVRITWPQPPRAGDLWFCAAGNTDTGGEAGKKLPTASRLPCESHVHLRKSGASQWVCCSVQSSCDFWVSQSEPLKGRTNAVDVIKLCQNQRDYSTLANGWLSHRCCLFEINLKQICFKSKSRLYSELGWAWGHDPWPEPVGCVAAAAAAGGARPAGGDAALEHPAPPGGGGGGGAVCLLTNI